MKQIRHDVGNNSQVDQPIELIKEFRANGHKAEARLDGDNDDHAENRRTPAINFRKAFREETFCGGLLEHFGDRELPAKRGTRAGKNQEEGHELSDGGIEHQTESQTERRVGCHQLGIRDNTCNDVGGRNINNGNADCGRHDDNRHVLLRVFNGIAVGAGTFQA